MKSSTFSMFAIGFVLSAYAGMAALEQYNSRETQEQTDAKHWNAARAQCGNADWTMIAEGEKLTVTCERRKPLRIGKAKP